MRRLALLVVALGGLVLPSSAGAYVYWTNVNTGTIGRAGLDGGGANQSFITGASFPYGVAVDGSRVYWSNNNQDAIGRAGLGGAGADQSFITGGNFPYGVAVDGSHLYWANAGAGTIARANLDGTGVNQSFISGASSPTAVAVDGSHVYWTNTSTTKIGRADLAGGNINQSFITTDTGAYGLAVDGSHIYWSNSGNLSYSIGRADLDGNNPNQTFITGANAPNGVAVDGSHVYWANSNGSSIGRAGLDGNNVNESFITGAASPLGVAVDAFTASPTLTTSASGGGTLGRAIHDTATLAGGASPSGSITFKLYGPGHANCTGAPAFTDEQNAGSGNGTYQSASYTPTAAGTYRWVASYSGDATSEPVTGACGAHGESVKIVKPDTTAPQTAIARAAVNSSKRKATFQLHSSERGSTFECSLDGKPFKSCESKVLYRTLKPGKHVFKARATDKAGNTDRTPAKTTFAIGSSHHRR